MTRIELFPFLKLLQSPLVSINGTNFSCQMREAYHLLFLLFLSSPSSNCVSKSAFFTSRPHLRFIPSFHIICISLMKVSITTHLEFYVKLLPVGTFAQREVEYRKNFLFFPSSVLGSTQLFLVQFHTTIFVVQFRHCQGKRE